MDLVPTVLDALGMGPPEGLAGRSLLALPRGQGAGEPPAGYFEALTGLDQPPLGAAPRACATAR